MLPWGSSYWRTCDEVLVVTWMDDKPVHFLTTLHNTEYPEEVETDEIPIPDWPVKCGDKKEAAVITCPPCVHDDNKHGGVDFAEKIIRYYNCGCRSKKWYGCIIYHLSEVVTHNAYDLESYFVLHRVDGKLVRKHQIFREDPIAQFINGFSSVKIAGRPSILPLHPRKQNVDEHVIEFKEKHQDCSNCSETVGRTVPCKRDTDRHKLGIRLSTVFCRKCQVHLCFDSKKDCWNYCHF